MADAYGEAERVRGEGDAKAAEIYARAYGQDPEFYRFYRSMEAYKKGLSSDDTTMVLTPDSEFFRYFRDPESKPQPGQPAPQPEAAQPAPAAQPSTAQ